MTIHRLDKLVALLLILFGIYLVWTGFGFGFMQGTTPGAGYFPVIAGSLLIVLSALNLIRSLAALDHLKPGMSRPDAIKFVAISAAMVTFVVITPILGMTIATMLLMLAIGLIIRPTLDRPFLIRLGLTSVLTPIACLIVFGTLLRVPVPRGIFGL
jgi:hypothetical protein